MKALKNKFFIFHFSFFILLSCSSIPKEYLTNDDICHYNDPIFKITKDEMTFNVEKYKSDFKIKPGPITIENNKKFKNEVWTSNNRGLRNKQTNKKLNIQKLIRYDSLGKISYSYITYLNGNARIGKRTYFDLQGNITKVIDYEKGYKICWAEAIAIVKQIAKKDIKKYQIKAFYVSRNDLNEFPTAKPVWTIGLMNGNEKFSDQKDKKGNIRYVINGITGKLINTFRVKMTY
ncbi:MAG: hypothetical protein L3J23_01780 [Flavobacteriaceae bacterium]|nr:hypothetical protein [Flavobacteriaceae bacterium]